MLIIKKIWRPLLAILLIFILIKKGPFDLNQLKSTLLEPEIILSGLLIFFLQILIFTYRWKLFVDLVTETTFSQLLKLNLIGMFFNFFIPGGVGGDIVKAFELSKNNDASRSQSLSTVMSDRVFGLLAMIGIASLFLVIEYSQLKHDYLFKFCVISLLMFLGMCFALLFLPMVFQKISQFLSGRQTWFLTKLEKVIGSLHFTFLTFRNIGIQLKSFTLSATSQFLAIYFLYKVVVSLGIAPPSFLIFFSLCCFGFVASALPIMPGGIGVGQAAFYFMFLNINEKLATATITAVTLLQIFQLFFALLGGIFFSFMPKEKKETLINTST